MKAKDTVRPRTGRWQEITGLDFHVLLTLLLRGWGVLAGGGSLLLLPLCLSPTQQGYYFTFGSVLAMQVFFELGLGQVVVQLVSHEFAQLHDSGDGRLQGPPAPIHRLGALSRWLVRWYRVAALLFALFVTGFGVYFFARQGSESSSVWLGPWLVLVLASAGNLALSPELALLEGCGRVGQVARLRLVLSVLGYALFWLLLLAGAGLWAALALPLCSLAGTLYWLGRGSSLARWLRTGAETGAAHIDWRHDVLPLQWRMALSWASGYLIFHLFTPLVFARQGAAEAGRLGLALTLFSSISTVGLSWVNAKAPSFTVHIARGERAALNLLFRAVCLRSTVVVCLASAALVAVVAWLDHAGVALSSRILSPSLLSLLAVVTCANALVAALATYMRAHREEPMLAQSVVMGLLVAAIAYFGSVVGLAPMLLAYLAAVAGVSLPWTFWLFRGYYRRHDGG